MNGDQFSKIIIRGIGITESQNQIDKLTSWFNLFVTEINNFEQEKEVKKK